MLGKIVQIHTFDDGNQRYNRYTNEWIIKDIKYSGSKLYLVNVHDKDINIPSISAWKVKDIEYDSKKKILS